MSRPNTRITVAGAVLTSLVVAGACNSNRGQHETASTADSSTQPYNSGAIGDGFGTGGRAARRVVAAQAPQAAPAPATGTA